MTKYMHTLRGEPAFFCGEQICSYKSFGKANGPLRNSLKEIRLDQRKTYKFRESKGFEFDERDYGYIRIEV